MYSFTTSSQLAWAAAHHSHMVYVMN